MNDVQILKLLKLPASTHIKINLPMNQLESQLSLPQRKLLQEAVASRGIRMLASINQTNSNINKYEDDSSRYEEIIILLIKMTNINKAKEVYKILSSKMPYPLIIFFEQEEKMKVILSEHEKTTENYLRSINILEIDITNQLETITDIINFESMDKNDLHIFHDSIMKTLIQLEVKRNNDVETNITDYEKLEQLKSMDKQIEALIKLARKEKQMNRRIQYQMEATKLKERKKQLLQED